MHNCKLQSSDWVCFVLVSCSQHQPWSVYSHSSNIIAIWRVLCVNIMTMWWTLRMALMVRYILFHYFRITNLRSKGIDLSLIVPDAVKYHRAAVKIAIRTSKVRWGNFAAGGEFRKAQFCRQVFPANNRINCSIMWRRHHTFSCTIHFSFVAKP